VKKLTRNGKVHRYREGCSRPCQNISDVVGRFRKKGEGRIARERINMGWKERMERAYERMERAYGKSVWKERMERAYGKSV
jgi:hypothetical protein